MTREQIEKMEAGREMDALVAEWVLGYTHDQQRIDAIVEVEDYSNDIAAAWQVVEDFGCAYVKLEHACNESEDERVDGWWCEIVVSAQPARAFAVEAPLAICRCALLATLRGE